MQACFSWRDTSVLLLVGLVLLLLLLFLLLLLLFLLLLLLLFLLALFLRISLLGLGSQPIDWMAVPDWPGWKAQHGDKHGGSKDPVKRVEEARHEETVDPTNDTGCPDHIELKIVCLLLNFKIDVAPLEHLK